MAVKQRYYPMRGFGNFDSASRFCRAFDEQRQYFRLRTTMRQCVPPLSEQRREHCVRWSGADERVDGGLTDEPKRSGAAFARHRTSF